MKLESEGKRKFLCVQNCFSQTLSIKYFLPQQLVRFYTYQTIFGFNLSFDRQALKFTLLRKDNKQQQKVFTNMQMDILSFLYCHYLKRFSGWEVPRIYFSCCKRKVINFHWMVTFLQQQRQFMYTYIFFANKTTCILKCI